MQDVVSWYQLSVPKELPSSCMCMLVKSLLINCELSMEVIKLNGKSEVKIKDAMFECCIEAHPMFVTLVLQFLGCSWHNQNCFHKECAVDGLSCACRSARR